MANTQNKVSFKKGLQTAYTALTNRDASTFYVTSDTHRLYLGDDLLSQAVEIVDSINGLTNPVAGQIYYVEGQNILAIYDSKQQGWTQINPDTAIQDIDYDAQKITDGAQLVLKVSQTNGGAEITRSINIKGANGNIVSVDGNGVVTIAAPLLGLKSVTNGAAIVLDNVEARIIGKGNSSVTYNSDLKQIEINSEYTDNYLQQLDSGVDDRNGFAITVNAGVGESDGSLNTLTTTATINPVIRAISKVDGNTVTYGDNIKFVDGVAKLDVYDTAYIDKALQDTLNEVNAMTYKGKLEPNSNGVATLPTSKVQIGDTYILAADATVGGTPYKAGTLFIARGTEDDTGYIISDLTFDSVQTADTDTTYTLSSDGANTVSLDASTGVSTGEITIKGDGSLIDVAKTSSTTSHTFTVSHKNVTTTTTVLDETEHASGAKSTLDVVENITTDGKGHVTKISTRKHTITDTVLDPNGSDVSSETTSNKTNITLTVADTASNSATLPFSLSSNSLTLSDDGKGNIAIDLCWGSF